MSFTLFPAVDIRGGRAVRPRQGTVAGDATFAGDPVAVARGFADQGARWLHVVDLDAAFTGVPRNRSLVADIVAATGLPVQASGGVRSMADLDDAISLGASRVVIGTMALEDLTFVRAALDVHGEKVTVGLDAEGTTLKARGRGNESGDLFDTVEALTELGVSRFVFTDVSRDGMLAGPNLDRLHQVAETTTAMVTASGGVSSLDDLRALVTVHRRVDGAVIGKALSTGRFTLPEALAVCASADPDAHPNSFW